jgi:hypothetical protein
MSHDSSAVSEAPLLAQAEHRLAAARGAEHRLRRDALLPGSGTTWEAVLERRYVAECYVDMICVRNTPEM